MHPIAGRPPPTYKCGPDPEFWRSFTRSTQPSTDDAASDPGRRLGGQNSYAAAAAWRLVLQRIRQRHRNEYWRISFFQPESCSSRKPALSGAPLLKSFTTQASVWPASKPIAADNHQPNAGYLADSERMARAPGPSLFSSQGLRNRRHTALGNISRRLPCERKEVKEHEAYQSPTAEAGGTDRTRRLRLWKRRQPRLQESWLQEPRLQVSCTRWCNQTQGTHQASVALWTPGGSRTNRGWRKRSRPPLLRIPRFLRRNS